MSSGGTQNTSNMDTSKNVTKATTQGQTVSVVGKPGQVVTTSKGETLVLSAPNLTSSAVPVSLNTSKPVITVSALPPGANSPAVQAILKRSFPTMAQNQVLTKVIITKNPNTNRIVSASVASTTPKLTSAILQAVDGKVLTPGSPVKVVTVTQGSLLNTKNIVLTSSAMSQLMAAQAVTPSSTQVKSPLKSVSTTPKKIAPAPPRPQQVIIKGLVSTANTIAKTTPSVTTAIASGVQNASAISSLQQAGTSLTFTSAGNLQPIQVAGNKFPYIRLVSVPSSTISTNTQAKNIVQHVSGNKVILSNASGLLPQQYQMQTVPIAPATQIVMKSTASSTTTTAKRMIMPNRPLQIQPNTVGGQLPGKISIPAGTTLLAGNSIPQNIAVLPLQYIAPVGQQSQNCSTSSYIPISTKAPTTAGPPAVRHNVNGSQPEAPGTRPRKPCNCTRSQCLKLYCDCFANGEFCSNCNCNNCLNNLAHEDERSRAIRSCLERNPQAFHPKIGKGRGTAGERRHNKGCNCKRSGCLKNYCECYEAKILCSSACKCYGCKNFEESPERKTLMHLADAAEVRVQQQTAAKSKLSQFQDFPSKPPITNESGERLPYSFITNDVAEATCQCLLAQAEETERNGGASNIGEQLILEEFGRCLKQIIESAGKTKGNGNM
ncbi:protein lin-54 homolog isoform X2 [Anneissia japonica]|uniref:protein lin-54 homolog isoform X2 n=1 Tax=Anneissia japonica TaxID=1529436 RepID=UPI0014255FF2|nr:protein lin-54 homolog isoform X2 [Anneissia japonica]